MWVFKTTTASAGNASAEDKVAAEALFDAALTLMRQGNNREACPKLEQSQRIDPGIGTLLYLGECYENLGRTASAWATFREALSAAKAARQMDRMTMAEERLAKLEPTLSKLRIEVSREARAIPGLVVLRAGQSLDSSLWGVPVPADPGEIVIEVRASGYETWSERVVLGSNADTQSIVVPALRAEERKPAAIEQEPQPAADTTTLFPRSQPDAEKPGKRWRTIGLALGGAGVAGMGAGAYFGVRAISKNNEALDYCPSSNRCTDQRGITRTDEAKNAALLSNIMIGVGAAATIGGAVLYFMGPRDKQPRINVAPMVGQQNGVRLSGAFQ